MTITDAWISDAAGVLPGDRIEVWDQDHLRHRGTVSQVAPHLGMLWIFEDATGVSKLIPAQDYRLRHAPVTQPA